MKIAHYRRQIKYFSLFRADDDLPDESETMNRNVSQMLAFQNNLQEVCDYLMCNLIFSRLHDHKYISCCVEPCTPIILNNELTAAKISNLVHVTGSPYTSLDQSSNST